MKRIFLLTILCYFSLGIFGQTIKLGDSVKVTFLRMDQLVSDSSHLCARISFENISKKPIYVYNKLSEGYLNDRFYNISMTVEKEVNGKYVNEPTRYYHYRPEILYADSLRHFDLPKSQLSPLHADTLLFDLHHLGMGFYKGDYRLKISLRVQTITDNTEYHHDSTGATVPPEDELKYISSDWIYFKVTKQIYQDR